MSDSNNTTAGTEQATSTLEAAYHRQREPIERCRCLEEFSLVPQHVRLEGLIIRQGTRREIVASGVRVLIRSQPVGSAPVESESEQARCGASSWFDPVPEGEPLQRSTEIFIDRADLAEFTRGLRGLRRIAERWPEHMLREHEAVLAWDRRLVFRTVKCGFRPADFLSCEAEPLINLALPDGRIGELMAWLQRLQTALAEAQDA